MSALAVVANHAPAPHIHIIGPPFEMLEFYILSPLWELIHNFEKLDLVQIRPSERTPWNVAHTDCRIPRVRDRGKGNFFVWSDCFSCLKNTLGK